jgi:hypothetical protein
VSGAESVNAVLMGGASKSPNNTLLVDMRKPAPDATRHRRSRDMPATRCAQLSAGAKPKQSKRLMQRAAACRHSGGEDYYYCFLLKKNINGSSAGAETKTRKGNVWR